MCVGLYYTVGEKKIYIYIDRGGPFGVLKVRRLESNPLSGSLLVKALGFEGNERRLDCGLGS